MKQSFFALLFLIIASMLPVSASAGDCVNAKTNSVTGTAKVTSGVNVRSDACSEQIQTDVLGVAPTGDIVSYDAEQDGWYRITTSSGITGWVWQSFLDFNVSVDVTPVPIKAEIETEKDVVEQEEPVVTKKEISHTKTNTSLNTRLKGYILLQVESVGEAWYVHPETGYRYYMKDGATAYEMMRAFGLGITDADLAQIPVMTNASDKKATSSHCYSGKLGTSLAGKILLQVQQHGEAWYVEPDTCHRIYMKDGEVAYSIMRELSLGITNKDLETVASKEFQAIQSDSPNTDTTTESEEEIDTDLTANSDVDTSTFPELISLDSLNKYWLHEINLLRSQAGLNELVIDDRWIETATEWSTYMGENQQTSHTRADGKSMHQWIDSKGLDFTERYSDGGWKTNYFTENISWGIADSSPESVFGVLDDSLQFYLNEGPGGVHYRTIYYEDWNSVGAGFYFEDLGDGTYKVYCTFHYGSLEI